LRERKLVKCGAIGKRGGQRQQRNSIKKTGRGGSKKKVGFGGLEIAGRGEQTMAFEFEGPLRNAPRGGHSANIQGWSGGASKSRSQGEGEKLPANGEEMHPVS